MNIPNKYCLKCKTKLNHYMDFSSLLYYCRNKRCERYGLFTVAYIEKKEKKDRSNRGRENR